MEYIIILDPDTKGHSVVESDHLFLEKFSSYNDAVEEAEIWEEAGDCKDYTIYVSCSDDAHEVI